jgi:hypothetical protein
VSFPTALQLFAKAFPDYFETPLYKTWEREYKDQASVLAKTELAEPILENLLRNKDCEFMLCSEVY